MTTIIQITDSLGSATPSAINNSGEVVGNIVGATGAWIWKNGLTTNLGALPGDNYIYAASINSSGQVVGYSEPSATADLTVDGLGPQLIAESHAFLWQNGVMTDLNPLIGQTFSSAVGINDAGNIAVEAAGTESLGAVNVTISYVTGAYDLVNGVASSLPGIPLESSITTAIYGINNSNQVV